MENALILSQILSTILKRNVWRSVRRIWMWILGLKGLNSLYVPGSELTDGLCCLRVSNHMSRNAIFFGIFDCGLAIVSLVS